MSESFTAKKWTLHNRTGLARSRDRDRMRESVQGFVPTGTGEAFRRLRMRAREDMPPIGTMPPPANLLTGTAKQALKALQGKDANQLLDKLGERLAFERTGARLYDVLIEKVQQHGSYDGGPTVEALIEIRDDEIEHFRTVARVMTSLDGDPTAITPSANLAAVASSGLVKVVGDPRTTVRECLEAMLFAELIDGDAWDRLIALTADASGDQEVLDAFRAANEAEARHLQRVQGWLNAAFLPA